MEKLVPLISSTVAGPSGVCHLPRLWLKAVLAESDALADGWVPDYRGFNKQIVDALRLDPTEFFNYLASLPSYPETERWIASHGAKLDQVTIEAANEGILTKERSEEAAAPLRARLGLTDSTYARSARLNDLDDWDALHAWLVAHRDETLEPIIPTVSSSSSGPVGLRHLPRLWIKALLNGVGALPDGYNSGCGFDAYVSGQIGLDLDAAVTFIHRELPSYLAFENWVLPHVDGLADPVQLEGYNRAIIERQKPEEKAEAERLEAGVPELSFREVIMCNDMLDWKALHDEVLARRATITA
jgi:hypothetical protein